ncbi:hypothetical protein ACFQ7B_42115 [Streptomyces erythrochromogenes]|uniref:hypothetical protein n=1 Tax=Streptomyces erythrochromogenes TaxID=285574 RepID=UPI0036A085C8
MKNISRSRRITVVAAARTTVVAAALGATLLGSASAYADSGRDVQPAGQDVQPAGQDVQPAGRDVQPAGQPGEDVKPAATAPMGTVTANELEVVERVDTEKDPDPKFHSGILTPGTQVVLQCKTKGTPREGIDTWYKMETSRPDSKKATPSFANALYMSVQGDIRDCTEQERNGEVPPDILSLPKGYVFGTADADRGADRLSVYKKFLGNPTTQDEWGWHENNPGDHMGTHELPSGTKAAIECKKIDDVSKATWYKLNTPDRPALQSWMHADFMKVNPDDAKQLKNCA